MFLNTLIYVLFSELIFIFVLPLKCSAVTNILHAEINNSDKPGQHDFKVLKRLVLSDGSVLRAKYPGRPTRDCLFNDPVTDGKR